MSRGGTREGAGRKSAWSSDTLKKDLISIRIPKTIKEELLTIAHKLDRGEEITNAKEKIFDSVAKIKQHLSRIETNQAAIAINQAQQLYPPESTLKCKETPDNIKR